MKEFRFLPIPYKNPKEAWYQHQLVSLAEGFRALGVPYCSSQDYWLLPDGTYLLPNTTAATENPFIITTHAFVQAKSVRDLSSLTPSRLVYLDGADGWRTPATTSRDFSGVSCILRSHYNDRYRYSSSTYPWAFGLSSRIIEATCNTPKWEKRSNTVLFNFRAGHPLREYVARNLIPQIKGRFFIDGRTDTINTSMNNSENLYWSQTGRRHYSSYYERLKTAKVCAAFGGYFAPGVTGNLTSFVERFLYKIIFCGRIKTNTLMQWDSWRLWEAWAASCVVLHIDLNKYGCRLPVQPINWVHYVGFDLDNLNADIARFLSLTDEELCRIAMCGHEWAIKNYSPQSVALRFISLVDQIG